MKVIVDEKEPAIVVEELDYLDEIIVSATEQAKNEGIYDVHPILPRAAGHEDDLKACHAKIEYTGLKSISSSHRISVWCIIISWHFARTNW